MLKTLFCAATLRTRAIPMAVFLAWSAASHGATWTTYSGDPDGGGPLVATTCSGLGVNAGSAGAVGCGTLNSGTSVTLGFESFSTNLNNTVGSTAVGTTYKSASTYNWGSAGMGVVAGNENSGAEGPHAVDNMYGNDMMLLSFSAATNLTGVRVGWNGHDNASSSPYDDSDLTVLAWAGVGSPTPTSTSIVGKTAAQLLTAGWKLIGNYSDVGYWTNNTAALSAKNADNSALYSSYWLVSAYTSSFGSSSLTTSAGGSTTADAVADAFKVLAVSGSQCAGQVSDNKCGGQTPEPGSLALLGVAGLGFLTARRRMKKA